MVVFGTSAKKLAAFCDAPVEMERIRHEVAMEGVSAFRAWRRSSQSVDDGVCSPEEVSVEGAVTEEGATTLCCN